MNVYRQSYIGIHQQSPVSTRPLRARFVLEGTRRCQRPTPVVWIIQLDLYTTMRYIISSLWVLTKPRRLSPPSTGTVINYSLVPPTRNQIVFLSDACGSFRRSLFGASLFSVIILLPFDRTIARAGSGGVSWRQLITVLISVQLEFVAFYCAGTAKGTVADWPTIPKATDRGNVKEWDVNKHEICCTYCHSKLFMAWSGRHWRSFIVCCSAQPKVDRAQTPVKLLHGKLTQENSKQTWTDRLN